MAIALIGVIAPQLAGAPARAVPRVDLRRLVLSGLGLYGVGAVASLTHHQPLAAVVYAAGIVMCALAAWPPAARTPMIPPKARNPSTSIPRPIPTECRLWTGDDSSPSSKPSASASSSPRASGSAGSSQPDSRPGPEAR